MKLLIGIMLIILSCIGITTCTVKNIQFDRNCGGYLKRAADANTIELAKVELSRAIKYMDENNLKSGYTSVIYTTPDEDVGFWYTNVTKSYTELNALDSTSTSLEKSNMLMKLRETLLDHQKDGDSVTLPAGISRYPNNAMWGVIMWISSILFLIGIGMIVWDILDSD